MGGRYTATTQGLERACFGGAIRTHFFSEQSFLVDDQDSFPHEAVSLMRCLFLLFALASTSALDWQSTHPLARQAIRLVDPRARLRQSAPERCGRLW